MNTNTAIALAVAATAVAAGEALILAKKIKQNRRYAEACKQLGWKPVYEFPVSPALKAV